MFCVLQVPNLVFLAVSPEEKESWINVLNAAVTRAKNRILDEVRIRAQFLKATPGVIIFIILLIPTTCLCLFVGDDEILQFESNLC